MLNVPHLSPCTFVVQDTGSEVQCIFDGVLFSSLRITCSQAEGYYLIYISAGQGILRTHNTAAELSPGTLVYVDRARLSALEIIQPPLTLSFFLLKSAEAANAHSSFSKDDIPVFDVKDYSKIPELIARLLRLTRDSSESGRLQCRQAAGDMITELSLCKSVDYENTILPPLYISSMKQLLDTRFSEPVSLDTISNDLHINKYKLAKEFKTYYHISPIEYLIGRRIQAACDLLLTTPKTITQIGIDVAMENTSYFVRLFKRYKGITPLQFRIRNQA